MKVYYSASISRSKKLLPISKDLVRYIKELGHEVLTEHLVDEEYSQGVHWDKDHNGEQVYKNAEKKLQEADVLITECTVPSFGAAFWIEKALAMGKPILSLHYGLDYKNAPLILQGDKDRINLQVYTEDNARHIIKKFLENL